jgi:enamine deaminase RidA (YjgF/YER057c/UK114 family)
MGHPPPTPAPDPRREFLGAALLGLAAGSVMSSPAQAGATGPGAPSIKALSPRDAPAAAKGYSPGVVAEGGRVVFVSGQGPADLRADKEVQIRQTFDRIGAVLKAAGASFKDVVMMRAYFVHLARDLPIYRKVRTDYLREPYPASTAVGVTELAVPGLEVEIEAVAVL